jgi:hypothetical protein
MESSKMIPCGKILAAAALVASATVAGPAGAAPMSAPRGLENAATAPVEAVQWRGRGGRGGYYRGRGNWVGPAIGGLAAGAIIGGALAARPYYYDGGYAAAPAYGYEYGPDYDDGAYVAVAPRSSGGDAVAYCMQRYRSYDPASGTFLGYDGMRHPCP